MAEGERTAVDWQRLVRHRRRTLLLVQLGILAAYLVFLAVVSVQARALPTPVAWALLGLVLLVTLVPLWPLTTAQRRARWTEQALWAVRVEYALREHAGIGAEDRDAVTERARGRRTMAGLALFGYPLLAVLVAWLLFGSGLPTLVASIGTALAAVLCGLGLLGSRRRGAQAARWLADPQPPGH